MWLTAKQKVANERRIWNSDFSFELSFILWFKQTIILYWGSVYEAYTVNHTQKDTKRIKLPHFFDLGH